jgi:hypothetical protein
MRVPDDLAVLVNVGRCRCRRTHDRHVRAADNAVRHGRPRLMRATCSEPEFVRPSLRSAIENLATC